jgi:glycosyltransferase involved in cell wall biosynthesis
MKVSVCMPAYNHAPFIAQAINSVLMQQTDFEYELIIGEDCSTDNTRDIVVDYKRKYPDKIRLLLNENNIGMQHNSLQILQAASGEYIAMLEGDDYWTSPHKLQKQVAHLDCHRDLSMCFHNVMVFKEGHNRPFYSSPMRPIYTLEDIAVSNFIHTPSVMFRAKCFSEFPPMWYSMLPMGDWPSYIICAQKGGLGYIDENMATYRVHAGGIWSSQSPLIQIENNILASTIMQRELALGFPRITTQIETWRKQAILLLLNSSDYARARYHAKRLLTPRHFALTRNRKSLLMIMIEVYAPSLYRFLQHAKNHFRLMVKGYKRSQPTPQ